MFDEKEIIEAARKAARKVADQWAQDFSLHRAASFRLMSVAFAAFADELQRVSDEKQMAWLERKLPGFNPLDHEQTK